MSGQGGSAPAQEAPQAGAHYLQVQTTTDSRAEAMELARAAVEARLAACAQVAGPVASTYWWEGSIERAEEWLLLMKLPAGGYQALADFITRRHSYDEPEIVALPIVGGPESYLSWIEDETRQELPAGPAGRDGRGVRREPRSPGRGGRAGGRGGAVRPRLRHLAGDGGAADVGGRLPRPLPAGAASQGDAGHLAEHGVRQAQAGLGAVHPDHRVRHRPHLRQPRRGGAGGPPDT